MLTYLSFFYWQTHCMKIWTLCLHCLVLKFKLLNPKIMPQTIFKNGTFTKVAYTKFTRDSEPDPEGGAARTLL